MINYKNKILIATGGTGGHVIPAYGLAKYFVSKKYNIGITIDTRGLKFLKNQNSLEIKIINSSTIFKKGPIKLIISTFQIISALVISMIFLFKNKPKIIFGMGGYASFPICIAAKLMGINFIIYENNLCIGKANKYLLPFAYKLFTSYPDTQGVNKKYFAKTVHTGNIIREEIFNFKKDINLKETNTLTILILGGSQAAKRFAEILPSIFKKCVKENIKLKIIQQCLTSQLDKLQSEYKSNGIECELFDFDFQIQKYFAKVDFVITRSGSSILAELLNCRIPFVSVPLPSSTDNHQLKNAKYFEQKGFSFLIEEVHIEKNLFPLIKSIHKDKDLLNQIINNQKLHSDKKVFKKIENQIITLINDKN